MSPAKGKDRPQKAAGAQGATRMRSCIISSGNAATVGTRKGGQDHE